MRNGPYILIVPPSDYPGKLYRNKYAYEHHVVWWSYGKSLPKPGFLIHHKNENKHDNSIENLEMLSISEHAVHHHTGNPFITIECFWCGKDHRIKRKNYNVRVKKGQIRFFCSYRCGALHQHRNKG